jgi:hypothetical protein
VLFAGWTRWSRQGHDRGQRRRCLDRQRLPRG